MKWKAWKRHFLAAMTTTVLALGCATPSKPLNKTKSPQFAGEYIDLLNGAQVDSRPRLLHEEHPHYPLQLLKDRISGMARVAFLVETNGRPAQIQIVAATHPLFGSATRDATARRLYAPAMKDGRPVRVSADAEMLFSVGK